MIEFRLLFHATISGRAAIIGVLYPYFVTLHGLICFSTFTPGLRVWSKAHSNSQIIHLFTEKRKS